LYKKMSKYYDYFRYAEVVVKESNVWGNFKEKFQKLAKREIKM
jgi:hypothetical protein